MSDMILMPIVHLVIYIFTNNVPVKVLSLKMEIGSVVMEYYTLS